LFIKLCKSLQVSITVAEVHFFALSPHESHLVPSDFKKYPSAQPLEAAVVAVKPKPALAWFLSEVVASLVVAY